MKKQAIVKVMINGHACLGEDKHYYSLPYQYIGLHNGSLRVTTVGTKRPHDFRSRTMRELHKRWRSFFLKTVTKSAAEATQQVS
jgi:hypothetical protein